MPQVQQHHESDIMETRMALLITQRTVLAIVIIAFMTTMVRTQSEIPENKVIVDIRPVFLRGYDGMLQCRFNGAPLAVFWLKGVDLATGTNLVTWYPPPRVVSGSGYVSGKYNLTEDFSLVIHNVTDDDAGRYICRISNFNGFILRNYTEATVKTPPQDPFPTVDQCRTEADGRGTESCILTQETGADSTELTCQTMGAPTGVVSLSWTRGDTTVTLQTLQRSTNPDGVTEDVTVATDATPSADPYVCVAILPVTTRRQATMSVTLNRAPVVTTIEAVTTKNVTVSPPGPINKDKTAPITISTVCALSVIIIIIILLIWKIKKGPYKPLKSDQKYDEGPVSYLEIWELVEADIVEANDIVSKLLGNPERESGYDFVRSKADLYSELCEWKDKCTGDVRTQLNAAIEDEKKIKDFRAFTHKMVSLDDHDLEHICWHVQKCKETVQPVLRALYFHNENITKFPGDTQTSGNSRSDAIKNDLQLMKTWKEKSKSANPEGEGTTVETRQPSSRGIWCCRKLQTSQHAGDSYERTPMYTAGSEYVAQVAETLPPNRMVRVCLALEEAGRRGDESDKLVYHQLAKTFFRIKDEYKRDLTDEVLKEFALSITARHCQRLGNTLKLSADAIAKRNEEDLEMFKTDDMLKAWVLNQKCSNYEIRRRLRQAAEQCNRQEIAENFISKEQSEVMPSTTKLPACLTITNETQSPGASAPGSKDKSGNGASSQSAPHSSTGDLEEMQSNVAQPTSNIADSEVGFVSVISRDELDRIGRYAGPSVLLAFCKKYGVTVPNQQSPEGKELPCETKIINVLKPTLDSEHERSDRNIWGDPPRETLRQLLQNQHTRYACLLARRKSDDVFNVELIDLAFRLIMADFYPFAKALNISDQVLTPYKRNLGPHNLRQGTVKIMLQVNTADRLKMVKPLKQAGYSEEARALYFGCEIGLGDVVEVETRVDKAQLAKQLGVSDDFQSMGPDNQGKDDTLHQSVLLRWRDTVRSSTFNHRLELADALFRMKEEQLALDIISGVYRNRAIDNRVSELLAATIPETKMPTLSTVLDHEVQNEQNCQDVILTLVAKKKSTKLFAKSTKLSNELLGAGFYAFAHDIMAARTVDKKAAEKLRQEGIAINEKGENDGKKKTEGMEKATNSDTLVENTGNKDTRTGKVGENDFEPVAKGNGTIQTEEIPEANTSQEGAKLGKENDEASEEEANTNTNGTDGEQLSLNEGWFDVPREDVMQEKSGDRAAESKENTIKNVDTKEHGNTLQGSDKRKRDESSEAHLPDTTMDYSGEQGVHDVSQDMEAIAMSRSQFFM